MLKTVNYIAIALTLSLSTSVFAGNLGQSGTVNTVKTASTDLNHDELGGVAQEATLDVDISGNPTGGDDPIADVVIPVDLGTGVDAVVTGIGWDVTVEAIDPSWLSEATLDFNGAVVLSPGAGDDAPGTASYSSGGIVDITAVPDGYGGYLDLSFVATGGLMDLTLFEGFDDAAVAPDGAWLDGSIVTLEFSAVPEPSAFGMFAVLALGLLGFRRK
jgi:hypothetical protein